MSTRRSRTGTRTIGTHRRAWSQRALKAWLATAPDEVTIGQVLNVAHWPHEHAWTLRAFYCLVETGFWKKYARSTAKDFVYIRREARA